MKWCTYVTFSPAGHAYVGKGRTKRVLSGSYNGSGKALKDALKKYPRELWSTTVLEMFEDENAAYDAETILITPELLADEMCLNLAPGGKGRAQRKVNANRGRTFTLEHRAKISAATTKSNLGRKASAETKAKMSATRLGRKSTWVVSPEVGKKIAAKLTGRQDSPETRAKKSAAHKRNPA